MTASLPHLSRRSRWAALVVDSFASGDERWSGLTLYVVAYAGLTAAGLADRMFAAAAATW